MENLAERFVSYSVAAWSTQREYPNDPQGGMFKYLAEDSKKMRYSCVVQHKAPHGFVLCFDAYSAKTRTRPWSLVTVAAPLGASSAPRWVELGDGHDTSFPAACFLPPDKTWSLLEGFLLAPCKRPDSPLLTATSEIRRNPRWRS